MLNDFACAEGPYIAGSELSLADATIFPTLVFVIHMLPLFDAAFSKEAVLGDRVARWYDDLQKKDEVFARVHEEIKSALNKWTDNGRWDAILHAGAKDTADPTIFDKIVAKEIPSTIVFEDEKVLVFKDINPQAPTHLLVIPKKREGLTQLRKASSDHAALLGHMMTTGESSWALGDSADTVVCPC